jgi:PleD family two-component response regulator
VGASSILPQAQLRAGFLMAAAEEALFEAKRKGKDRVELNALNED